MRPPDEIRALTGLRALPAFLVVFFHFYRLHVPAALPLLPAVVRSGFVAVGMFFVLSGFILTCVHPDLAPSDTTARRAFTRARFARIYPVYALSLLVGFVAQLPGSARDLGTGLGWVRAALVVSLLNAFSRYGMFHLNWAAWSLSAEWLFYLIFPWLGAWLARRSDRGLALVFVAASLAGLVAPAAYTWLDPDHLGRPLELGDEILWSWYLKFFPLTHLHAFVLGVAAGRAFVRHRVRLAALGSTKRDLAVVMTVTAVVAILRWGRVPDAYLFTDVLAPLFAMVVVTLAAGPGVAARVLATGAMVRLGRASYALYLLHVPVFYLFADCIPDMWESATWFWPYLGSLLVVAALVHRFVEEPARMWIRGRGRPRAGY